MAKLNNRPLLDYSISTAKACNAVTRIICSTEDDRIADFCSEKGIEVHRRPAELAQDNTNVIDVMVHTIEDLGEKEGKVADIIPLLQATSPFLTPEQLEICIKKLQENSEAESSQTVTTFSPNCHAFNQRIIEGDYIRFRFPEERRKFFNKQLKPEHYIFGNLVVTRSSTILNQREIFGSRSLPHIITPYYAFDVDGPREFELAEWIIKSGKVIITEPG